MVKNTIKKNALAPTVLICGGAGFLGSYLVESLLANGAKVIVLDNFNTGKEIHVKPFLSNPNFALYNVDINQGLPPEIETVDYVLQLAGLEEYLFSKSALNLDSLLTNSIGTKNLLDLVKKSEAKFVLMSTIDVYQGRMSQADLARYFGYTEVDENKFSLAEAKRFAEAIVWEYFKKYDLDVRIVRLPELYGPKMDLDSSGSLGLYIKDLIESRNLVVKNDGIEKEYYLYVSDAVNGILKTLFNPNTKGNIYSLIPEAPISDLELAFLIRGLADGAVAVTFKQFPSSAYPSLLPPDTFNLKDLNWKPKRGLKDGVIETLKSFGYSANTNSFKPLKYVEEKNNEIQQNQSVSSLVSNPLSNGAALVVDKKTRSPFHLPEFKFKKPASSVKTYPEPKVEKRVSGRPSRIFSSAKFYAFTALFLAGIFVFVVNPFLQLYLSSKAGVESLRNLQVAAKDLDTAKITSQSALASKQFESASKNISGVRWVFYLAGKSNEYRSYSRTLISLKYFSDSIGHMEKAIEPVQGLWEVIRPDTDKTLSEETLNNAKLEISTAKNLLQLSEADFNSVNVLDFPANYQQYALEYKGYLSQAQSSLDLASDVISNLPSILGVDSPKKYIVWFQNSNELRATGGFIGSYGILEFDKGKLKDLTIDDIYNPDGQIQLRGIGVTPPAPIKEFLNEKVLYLRNSNWEPDFSSSVSAFDDLYAKLTGQKIDGYIAVDLSFVKGLIQATGPVFLAAYNEEINPENLYERTQFHSDFNYTDGSDQKRSFLTTLGSKLLEKLFTIPKDRLPELTSAINTALNEKHMLLYLSNSSLSQLLKQKNWDGNLVETPGDYLYVVNSNVGGTKANYFVEFSQDYKVSSMTRDGLLRGILTLNYKHTGTTNAWPGGPYKDYIRVYVKAGSKLTGAKLVTPASIEGEDVFKDMTVGNYAGLTTFEYPITLNPQEQMSLQISYDLPAQLSITKDQNNYSLYVQKQPGTVSDPFYFEFSYPFGMSLENKSQNLELGDSKVSGSGTLNADLNYFVQVH